MCIPIQYLCKGCCLLTRPFLVLLSKLLSFVRVGASRPIYARLASRFTRRHFRDISQLQESVSASRDQFASTESFEFASSSSESSEFRAPRFRLRAHSRVLSHRSCGHQLHLRTISGKCTEGRSLPEHTCISVRAHFGVIIKKYTV